MVKDAADVIRLIYQGNAVRHVGATQMNDQSSRSHSVFTIKVSAVRHITFITFPTHPNIFSTYHSNDGATPSLHIPTSISSPLPLVYSWNSASPRNSAKHANENNSSEPS
ncbi:hypothetical protein EON65_40060 [archaeon]|nr:MAG: hypothetical protein EON65_40060 [archaeon]